MNGYYVADVDDVTGRRSAVPDGVTVQPVTEADIPALAELYLRAYDPPAAETLDGALAEVTSAFDGAWGVLWPEESPAAWIDGALAGECRAGLTVDDRNTAALTLYQSLGFKETS